jgi:hypothetical protein
LLIVIANANLSGSCTLVRLHGRVSSVRVMGGMQKTFPR